MPGISARATIASLVLAVTTFPAEAANSEDITAKVGVHVRNFSEASGTIVQKAEAECQPAFLRAGIRITWNNASADIAWEGPDIVFRAAILPRAPRSRDIDVFGSARLKEREGVQLFVYYDRVIALSRRFELPVYLVLSGALMHELGHLLLRSSEHSVAGAMVGVWGKRELDQLGQGLLGFTPEQRLQLSSNARSSTTRH
jgi:hypothetical protein